jgi:hypothetical protein
MPAPSKVPDMIRTPLPRGKHPIHFMDTGPRHRVWVNTCPQHWCPIHCATCTHQCWRCACCSCCCTYSSATGDRRARRGGCSYRCGQRGRPRLCLHNTPATAQGAMLDAVSTHAHHSTQCTQAAVLSPPGTTNQLSLQLGDGAQGLPCPGCLCFLYAHTQHRHDGGWL